MVSLEMEDKWIRAITESDLQILQTLWSSGTWKSIDEVKMKWNRTSLLQACESSTEEICNWLLDSGANINARDLNQETPLHLTVRLNRGHLTKLLVAKGANLSAVNNSNQNVLHIAAQNDSYHCASLMLRHSQLVQKINAPDLNGNTPLHTAAAHASPRFVKLLLQKEADPLLPNLDEKRPRGRDKELNTILVQARETVRERTSLAVSPTLKKGSHSNSTDSKDNKKPSRTRSPTIVGILSKMRGATETLQPKFARTRKHVILSDEERDEEEDEPSLSSRSISSKIPKVSENVSAALSDQKPSFETTITKNEGSSQPNQLLDQLSLDHDAAQLLDQAIMAMKKEYAQYNQRIEKLEQENAEWKRKYDLLLGFGLEALPLEDLAHVAKLQEMAQQRVREAIQAKHREKWV